MPFPPAASSAKTTSEGQRSRWVGGVFKTRTDSVWAALACEAKQMPASTTRCHYESPQNAIQLKYRNEMEIRRLNTCPEMLQASRHTAGSGDEKQVRKGGGKESGEGKIQQGYTIFYSK